MVSVNGEKQIPWQDWGHKQDNPALHCSHTGKSKEKKQTKKKKTKTMKSNLFQYWKSYYCCLSELVLTLKVPCKNCSIQHFKKLYTHIYIFFYSDTLALYQTLFYNMNTSTFTLWYFSQYWLNGKQHRPWSNCFLPCQFLGWAYLSYYLGYMWFTPDWINHIENFLES